MNNKSEIKLDLQNQILKLDKTISSNRKRPLFSGTLGEDLAEFEKQLKNTRRLSIAYNVLSIFCVAYLIILTILNENGIESFGKVNKPVGLVFTLVGIVVLAFTYHKFVMNMKHKIFLTKLLEKMD